MRTFIDMAKTPAEVKDEAAEMAKPIEASVPRYPYGLAIRLEDDDLEKLSMKTLPAVGEMISGAFMAKVTSVSQRDTEGNKGYSCVELQITQLAVDSSEAEPDSERRSRRMYSAEKDED